MVEMLVTLVLLSVGVAGVTAGIAATERIATVNQDQSQLEVAMRQLADWARDSSPAGLAYSACDTQAQPATYQALVNAAVSGGVLTPGTDSLRVTRVYESTSAGGTRNGNATTPLRTCLSSNCTPAGSHCADWGVQEITVTVSESARSLTRTVWKSSSW